MKKFLLLVPVACMVLAGRPAAAVPEYTILGALLGAGAGYWVAHNSGDIDTDVAVPVGAILGGLLGRRWEERKKYEQYPVQYGNGGAVQQPRTQEQIWEDATRPQQRAPERQPGVDLIKIPITMANGATVDIPVWRVGGIFVGPQGEEYEELPTKKMLAERYGG